MRGKEISFQEFREQVDDWLERFFGIEWGDRDEQPLRQAWKQGDAKAFALHWGEECDLERVDDQSEG